MGLAVPKMGNLTLVAITVIVLSAVLLLWVVPVLIPQAVGFLQDMGILSGGGEELTGLENAIICSYYRCVDGCESMPDEIKDLEICTEMEVEACMPGALKKCKENFCDPFKDQDGKVCDDNARNNPIEVEVLEEGLISDEEFYEEKPKTIGDFDEAQTKCEDMRPAFPVVLISEERIDEEGSTKESCPYRHMWPPCYSKVKILEGDYYLWAHKVYAMSVYIGVSTLVCANPP